MTSFFVGFIACKNLRCESIDLERCARANMNSVLEILSHTMLNTTSASIINADEKHLSSKLTTGLLGHDKNKFGEFNELFWSLVRASVLRLSS